MKLATTAVALSLAPWLAAALIGVIAVAFPIVDHVRDTRAGIAMAVLALVVLAGWPIGLAVSVQALRRAEAGSARVLARAAMGVSAVGGVALLLGCAWLGILVAGLSMR